ncbi:MAG: toll/interleukin-1 receptor domain-containing protein [Chloroflexota bacterium]
MAETEFKYDVFVSYSSTNKEWVRKTFVPILEKAGLKVCDYYRDFDVGAPIVMEMERAVLESRKTIPILSPAYLKSGWTEFESLMFQTLDAANRNRRVLPVILEKCDLPLRIKYMNCINFADPDDVDIEWERLSRALEVTLSPSLLDTPKPITGSRDTWNLTHPYPMPPNFTGRAAEQKMLNDWLVDNTNRLFILRALGGFGKSALAWQWINTHVNPAEWTKLVFWSFYEGDASFEHFIEETLKYLRLEVPQGQRPQVDELLKAMQSQKILLIMDGFERALRLYANMNAAYQSDEEQRIDDAQLDCVNINAEFFLKGICSLPNVKSKVLMTTRLTPRAVKPRGEFMLSCREVELTSMQPADAVEFFRKQKIKGTHAEIEAACAPYGYHPLSLRILAGLITNDRESPSDIEVAEKLDITDDIIQNKNHVLKVSYDTISFGEQKLLSNMACFRSSISYQALKIITSKPSWKRKNKSLLNEKLDDSLYTLESSGLLSWNRKANIYDLHPIVRRYAYGRLTAPDRTAAHTRLRDYFAAVDVPKKLQTLDDLAPVIELYHHTLRAGELDEAWELFRDRIWSIFYYQLGAYQTQIELLRGLFINSQDKHPKLRQEVDRGHVLNELANAYSLNGQPHYAVQVSESAIQFVERLGDKKNTAVVLGNMADDQLKIGALRIADFNLRKRIKLSQEIQSINQERIGREELGRQLSYRGVWDEAERGVAQSFPEEDLQGLCVHEGYYALYNLLIARDSTQSSIDHSKLAIAHAQRSLELAEKNAQIYRPNEIDFERSHWLLGTAYRLDGQLNIAEHHLSEALTRCHKLNSVYFEADILLDLARLRYDQKKYEEAKNLADEALLITERCSYVLQGADVNLFLAQYALEQEKDKAKAKQYAEEAKKLATCDGPPYYYKVAYEEAERFLENLK